MHDALSIRTPFSNAVLVLKPKLEPACMGRQPVPSLSTFPTTESAKKYVGPTMANEVAFQNYE